MFTIFFKICIKLKKVNILSIDNNVNLLNYLLTQKKKTIMFKNISYSIEFFLTIKINNNSSVMFI